MNIDEESIKSKEHVFIEDVTHHQTQRALTITVVSSVEMFDRIAAEWKHLSEISDTYIFQTYEWNRIWWKHFGQGQQLHMLLFYQNEQLVGIAPLFLDEVKMLGRPVYSCLRFLGSIVSQPKGKDLKGLLPYSDYMDLIIYPGCEYKVHQKLMHYLKNNRLSFDEIILEEIPENSSLWNNMLPELREQNYIFIKDQGSSCPIIKLGCSWAEHLKNMSKSSRYKSRRFIKQAEKPGYKIFDIKDAESKEEISKAYELLVVLHQKRWKDLGYPGIFGEDRMYEFLKEITLVFFERGWAQCKMVYSLNEHNKCIAVDLLFTYKKRVYLVQRALDPESSATEHGPGNVSLNVMVRDAAENGMEEFDLLRGTEAYKFRSANSLLQNNTLTILNPNKKPLLNFGLTKRFIQTRRRMRVEHEQLKIFLKGEKGIFNNIYEYSTFLYNRLHIKMNSNQH